LQPGSEAQQAAVVVEALARRDPALMANLQALMESMKAPGYSYLPRRLWSKHCKRIAPQVGDRLLKLALAAEGFEEGKVSSIDELNKAFNDVMLPFQPFRKPLEGLRAREQHQKDEAKKHAIERSVASGQVRKAMQKALEAVQPHKLPADANKQLKAQHDPSPKPMPAYVLGHFYGQPEQEEKRSATRRRRT
jgi:hypothetical protein